MLMASNAVADITDRSNLLRHSQYLWDQPICQRHQETLEQHLLYQHMWLTSLNDRQSGSWPPQSSLQTRVLLKVSAELGGDWPRNCPSTVGGCARYWSNRVVLLWALIVPEISPVPIATAWSGRLLPFSLPRAKQFCVKCTLNSVWLAVPCYTT